MQRANAAEQMKNRISIFILIVLFFERFPNNNKGKYLHLKTFSISFILLYLARLWRRPCWKCVAFTIAHVWNGATNLTNSTVPNANAERFGAYGKRNLSAVRTCVASRTPRTAHFNGIYSFVLAKQEKKGKNHATHCSVTTIPERRACTTHTAQMCIYK